MKKGLETGFVYAGTVIGAGFVSGRELWQFFGRFGSYGILGLFMCCLLYLVLGLFLFTIIGKSKAQSVYELFGRRGKPIIWLNLAFMFVLFVSTTAAAGAVFEEITGFHRETGSLLLCLLVWFCVSEGRNGFSEVSFVLTPFLVLSGIVCGTALCPFLEYTADGNRGKRLLVCFNLGSYICFL
ncbi:MAG: hypothetical protein LUD77_05935 [Clostridiales bacterium]|nr:hypothetical protein [Clostridiales bacterium]